MLIPFFYYLALVNAYVQQNEEDYGKCIDAAHRYEAVIEGKHVTHQILDSDGKVGLVKNILCVFQKKNKVLVHSFGFVYFDIHVYGGQSSPSTSMITPSYVELLLHK